MTQETLDKTSELAVEKLAELNKAEADKKTTAEQKAAEEAKGASAGKSSTEKPKTEGITEDKKKVEDTDGTTKSDVVILETEDKELNEQELVRKQELIKESEEAKSPEDKLKDWQEKTQSRIDMLIGELKAEKDGRIQDKEQIKQLEEMIGGLKGDLENSGSVASDSVKEAKADEERYAKMVEDDKDLPRIQRREMSEEELEEFLLENYSKANQWIVRRELRREKEKAGKEQAKKTVTAINEGAKKLYAKYPDCNTEVRHRELVGQGKTNNEAIKILMGEVPNFKMMMELMRDNESFRDPGKGPELLMAEMEKRKTSSQKTYTAEEVEKMTQEAVTKEQERISSIDPGITNSTNGAVNTSTLMKDPLVKAQWDAWVKASKRHSARGQDWSEKAFFETLRYGKDQRAKEPPK